MGREVGSAAGRTFREHVAPAGQLRVSRTPPLQPNQPFRPLPPPTGASPYHLNLEEVLGSSSVTAIRDAGNLAFHANGDTGGIKTPESQQIVAMHMQTDLEAVDATTRPSFFYHLGDVVYYYGEDLGYYGQFYEPYIHYDGPILAIPGNHDGDLLDPSQKSLAAFVENFCADNPRLTAEAGDAPRQAMTQPNVYWTLEAPFVTIIGLYTNVPEGGRVDDNQKAWFISELEHAPADAALIVAMHHPIFSLDVHHSGSNYMLQLLDQATATAGRMPDMVLSGHVHNYQRFTRNSSHDQVPYLVAGAGGYWNLHYLQQQAGQPLKTPLVAPNPHVTLESYCDDRHGYLRLTVTPKTISGQYFSVPRPQESWRAPAQLVDSFALDLASKQLETI